MSSIRDTEGDGPRNEANITRSFTESDAESENSTEFTRRSGADTDRSAENSAMTVQAEIKLSGPLSDIMTYFDGATHPDSGADQEQFADILDDMNTLVETVRDMDGGIRSELASEADLQMSEDRVRCMLELLREYGLIELNQNTWVPSPELRGRRADE